VFTRTRVGGGRTHRCTGWGGVVQSPLGLDTRSRTEQGSRWREIKYQ